jgi:hypothetical protein
VVFYTWRASVEVHRPRVPPLCTYQPAGDSEAVGKAIGHALEASPNEALVLLSQTALWWEQGQRDPALAGLAAAQQHDRRITHAKGLADDHFWGRKALAAVEAMLPQLRRRTRPLLNSQTLAASVEGERTWLKGRTCGLWHFAF